MRKGVAVFIGGGLGSLARALVLQALAAWGSLVPVLMVNLVGAFTLGVVYVLADDAGLMSTQARLFAAVGVLGGFTTFSTFAWGADLSIAHGMPIITGVYVLASVVGGVASVALGIAAGHALVTMLERTVPGILVRLRHGDRRRQSVASRMGLIETENREDSE